MNVQLWHIYCTNPLLMGRQGGGIVGRGCIYISSIHSCKREEDIIGTARWWRDAYFIFGILSSLLYNSFHNIHPYKCVCEVNSAICVMDLFVLHVQLYNSNGSTLKNLWYEWLMKKEKLACFVIMLWLTIQSECLEILCTMIYKFCPLGLKMTVHWRKWK